MVLYGYMNNEENTQQENIQVNQLQVTQPNITPPAKRGRPRVNVNWPNTEFTFENLTESNKALSSSSLRKKMRSEISRGSVKKVGTVKSTFGRPKNVYVR